MTVTDLLLAAITAELDARRAMLDATGGRGPHSVNLFITFQGGVPKQVMVKVEVRREIG